jgi:hypothetical protein
MVSDPLRGMADVLACAVNRTSEEPAVPDAVIASHGAPLVADHGHAPGAVTRTEPDPPTAGAEPVSDPSSNVHVVPACETLIVWPATVRAAVRPVVDAALDEMVTPSVAFPLPVVGARTAHGALLDALHEQFAPFAEMPIVPVPPPDP